jgi:CBS domain-containing protein
MSSAAEMDFSRRTVADIMQHRVVTVTADAPLAEVARVLWDEQISGVPVLDERGQPIGFVSASDLVRYKAFGLHYEEPGAAGRRGLSSPDLEPLAGGMRRRRQPTARRSVTASDVMTPATLTVRSTSTVVDLARFLVRSGVHHALVLDDGRLSGIVSAYDIVQEVAEYEQPGQSPVASPDAPSADIEL